MTPKTDGKEVQNTTMPDIVDTIKGDIVAARIALARQHRQNEIALKGLYVDFVFDRLNLNRFR